MIPKSSIKPLELVISAIHCLKEKKGSSPQNILKYLTGKYNVSAEALKTHVQAGLKRGLSFGLITQKSGSYRLNDVLSASSDISDFKYEKPHKIKFKKTNKALKKKTLRRTVKTGTRKLIKPKNWASLKGKRKNQKSKEKKNKAKKKSTLHGENTRRNLNEIKRRKPNRRNIKTQKVKKLTEKVKRMSSEKVIEPPLRTEGTEVQHNSVNNTESEFLKTNVKA